MTGNQTTFTTREKYIALAALIAAVGVVAIITMANPRPYLGAYEGGTGPDAPSSGVLDARPAGVS